MPSTAGERFQYKHRQQSLLQFTKRSILLRDEPENAFFARFAVALSG